MFWLFVPLGYVVGSLPTAYIFGRLLTGRDIRKLGDRNMGARNAWHEISHRVGVAVFLIDGAKGFVAVLLAQLTGAPQVVILATGVAVVGGHNWPAFLGFRGGRGEATTIGVLYVLLPLPMLIMTPPAILSLLVFKNVILTSAVLFIGLFLINWWLNVSGLMVSYAILLPCIVALTHFFRVRLERPEPT